MNNRKILFVGGMFPKELEAEIMEHTIGQPQNAANLLQWSLIRGLEENTATPVEIFSSVFIGAYPQRYKQLIIKKKAFNHSGEENHTDVFLGFFNAPYLKHISKTISFKKELKKHLQSHSYDIIVGYSMTTAIIKSLLYAKKKSPSTMTCLVIPDLPEYMNLSKKNNFVFNILKKRNKKSLYRAIQGIDSFVILSKHMAAPLNIENKAHVVIEGIAPQITEIQKEETGGKKIKNIVYTGTLGIKYGIKDLVDAFHKLPNEDIRLLICGNGDAKPYIHDMSQIDQRIQYLGVLPQHEAHLLQQKAHILVNPRNSVEEYTKYSFPSKTMEYMLSGRPVLMYPLMGMPEEYAEHVVFIKNEENGLYNALKTLLETDDDTLTELGTKAKNFVAEQKSAKAQTKKILDMADSFFAKID